MKTYIRGYCDECGGYDCWDPRCQISRMTSVHVDHGHEDDVRHFTDIDGNLHGPFKDEFATVDAADEYLESIGVYGATSEEEALVRLPLSEFVNVKTTVNR